MDERKDAGGMNRAYSLLTVKGIDEETRTISGIASTPTVDRVGDIVMPLGAKFKTPMPLLLYHDSTKPVGIVDFAKPNKNGIPFKASIPNIKEAGTLKDRVDEAWQSVKYSLLAAVSIGFKPTQEKDAYEFIDTGVQYNSWEWLELSLVSVPAQPDAVITSFKSMDSAQIRAALHLDSRTAASGRTVRLSTRPGVSGLAGPAIRVVRLSPRTEK